MSRYLTTFLLLAILVISVIPTYVGYANTFRIGILERAIQLASSATFYYFLQITDLHLDSNLADPSKLDAFASLVKNVYANLPVKPLAVVCTGDIADGYGNYTWSYQYYTTTLDLSGTSIERLDTAGNHDVRNSTQAHTFLQYIGSAQYYKDIYVNATHYVRFIAVNTTQIGYTGGNLSSDKLDEVEAWIQQAQNDPNCIGIWLFGHHPPAPNTDENVSAGGWDYKATPFNDILRGDPWRFVRMVASYSKVVGYLYGHVHVNWVTIHYGKYFIGTAPLCLRGPWPSGVAGQYNGKGYVYRIVAYYNGKVSTYVAHPDELPVGLILNIENGDVLSGTVSVAALVVSSSEPTAVELYVDNNKVADFVPVNANSYGGLYVATLNVSKLSDWIHSMQIHVVDSQGREFWSPPIYFFARVAGGLRFVRSDLGMISFGIRENYSVARLYLYSTASEDFPFAAIYTPVDISGGYLRIKALLDTDQVSSYAFRLRFALVTWKAEPSYSDKHWNNAQGMMKLVAGAAIEGDANNYPYDFCAWRQKGDPSQWWGDYYRVGDWYVSKGYWLQIQYSTDGFTVERWDEGDQYKGPSYVSYSWSYANTEYDFDDIKYAGILVRSDTGYLSKVAIAYLEIEDAKGIRKYFMVPNILGIQVVANVTNVACSANGCNVTVSVTTSDGGTANSGKLVLQGSEDGMKWTNITYKELSTTTLQAGSTYTFVNVPQYTYYRVVYDPGYSTSHLYAVASSSPVTAVSAPAPVPEPMLFVALAVLISAIVMLITLLKRVQP